jgi:hypothetical protein
MDGIFALLIIIVAGYAIALWIMVIRKHRELTLKRAARPLIEPKIEQLTREADQKQCPTCLQRDVYRAVIEDGGQGDWCPNCKKSLQKMRPAPEIKITGSEAGFKQQRKRKPVGHIENFLKSIEAYIFDHRRTILWLGIAIIILMALFPPWVLEGFRAGGASFRIPQGHSFILSPPNEGIMVHVDLSRFLMQCLPIVIIVLFFYFMVKGPLSNVEIKGNDIKSMYDDESFTDSKRKNICPGCGLIKPENAKRCECGYDLINHDINEYEANWGPRKVVKWLILGLVWLAAAGLLASLVRSCLGSLNK